MENKFIHAAMAGLFPSIARTLKCNALKAEHFASDIKALGNNPSAGAIEVLLEKYEGKSMDEKQYALKWPEPIGLWKWAARNSRREDGGALAMPDFYKRSVRATEPEAGEPHETYTRRALFAALRALVIERKGAGGTVPPWVEDALAAEIAQK